MARTNGIFPEDLILGVLGEHQAEVPLSDLLDRLRTTRGFEDDASVKAALWRLISGAEIELTPHRRLRILKPIKARAAVR